MYHCSHCWHWGFIPKLLVYRTKTYKTKISYISLALLYLVTDHNYLVTASRFAGAARVHYIPVTVGTVTSTTFWSTIMDSGKVFTGRCPATSTVFTITSHVSIDSIHGAVVVHGTLTEFWIDYVQNNWAVLSQRISSFQWIVNFYEMWSCENIITRLQKWVCVFMITG